MIQINYEIQITPYKILSEEMIDTDDYITEKMPRGEGQGGEKDEFDTDRISGCGDLQSVMASLDLSREAKTAAGEQENVCEILQRGD